MMKSPRLTVVVAGAGKDHEDRPEGVPIPMPDGFEWPQDVDPKEGTQFMATVCEGPDGKLMLKDLDGMTFGHDEEEPDDEPPKGDMADLTMGLIRGKK